MIKEWEVCAPAVIEEWREIREGEPLRNGDVYGRNSFHFTIGTTRTSFKEGQPCPAMLMCYKPERRIS